MQYNLVGILILNLFVYKYLINCKQSSLILTKFVVGMILASITMFIAGTVEKLRQNDCFGIITRIYLFVATISYSLLTCIF